MTSPSPKFFKKIDGYSESAWISLAVKSVRLGWPEGIRQAALRLSESALRSTIEIQIMEDIYPPASELPKILELIKKHEWEAICAYDTHHGRNFTLQAEKACDEMHRKLKAGVIKYKDAEELAKIRGFASPRPRLYGDLLAWDSFRKAGQIPEMKNRPIDESVWIGMPTAMLDQHTIEGSQAQRRDTILSGSSKGHLNLANMVKKIGWTGVRKIVHSDIDKPMLAGANTKPRPRQLTLSNLLLVH